MTRDNRNNEISSDSGLGHWKLQRISAIINMPLILWFVFSIISLSSFDYSTNVKWIKEPINCVLIVTMLLSVFYHSSLGLQVVIEDYISELKTRAVLIKLTKILIFLLLIISIGSIINIYMK